MMPLKTAGAKRFALSCVCGATLVHPATGRPRRTCSSRCRRRLDHVTRKIRRRQAWVQGWQALAARGQVTAAEARREVAALTRDIRAFAAEVGR